MKLDVPYIHQVNDVDGADGNWACGPTSVLMVLAYYSKLEPWPEYEAKLALSGGTKLSAPAGQMPSSHGGGGNQEMKSNYAPYLTSAYTYNGHTYSATAPDPRGNRVAGLYGTIAPTGLADWGRIKQVLSWHGLQTQYASPTWNGVVAALKRGHPVLLGNDLTPAGHIMVAIGYTSNNQLIVNDPYGNRFAPGYGANNGQGLYYSWNCSRVHNALEVIGIYTPPTPVPTATVAPTATAIPVAPQVDNTVSGGVTLSSAPASSAGAVPTESPDVIMFAVQSIYMHASEQPDAISSSGSRAATGKRGPDTHILAAQRNFTAVRYWWLTPPTFLALAGFLITVIDRRRKRSAELKWTSDVD
jgi:hypothetical protein